MSVLQNEEYLKLDGSSKKVFEYMLSKARETLELCKNTPDYQPLTKNEYESGHPDFKVLVETPWVRKEFIYIACEFVEGQLNPKLKRLQFALERNLPYHAIITEGYAKTWPLLLRLYYGLQSGFRISAEQLHSMMRISYWRALGVKLETIPLGTSESSREMQLTGGFLCNIFDSMSFEQANRFMSNLNKVPLCERTALKIELDETLINICNFVRQENSIPAIARQNRIPIWKDDLTDQRMKAKGLQMFAALLKANVWPYHPLPLNNKLYLVLPSQSFIQAFAQAVNPTRSVKYVMRLGAISAAMMASHSKRNERAGNFAVPGVGTETDVSNYIVHLKVAVPALLFEHDNYHYGFEATISKLIYDQINYIPDVLRNYIRSDVIWTSEMERCFEREKSYEFSEQERFFELLKYVFAVDPDAEGNKFKLRKSSLLVLIDMVLKTEKWPYYHSIKTRIINLLLPRATNNALVATEVERVIQDYFLRTKKDLRLLALLLIIHFYLNDENLCSAILSLLQPSNAAIQLTWKKGEDTGLEPIFVCANKTYSLDHFANMQPQERMRLLVSKTLYSIPDEISINEKVRTIILDNQGEIVTNVKPFQFTMPCASLTSAIRNVLGLDRVRSVNPEALQLEYLKRSLPEIIIEKDPSKEHSFLCTFPARKRPLVESILNPEKWLKTKLAVLKIQAHFRGRRERSHFFKEVTARKNRIQNLKFRIKSANEEESFTAVSMLAMEAQQEVRMLKKEEKVIQSWSRYK